MSHSTSTTRKALVLSAAAVLAACSRNPKPGMDETGRADTTVTDTMTRQPIDTIRHQPTDTLPFDTTRVRPAPLPQPTPRTDSSNVGRDTSLYQPPAPNRDTSRMLPDSTMSDSARVPHSAKRAEGDSAMIQHNVPDSTGRSADSTGR